MTTEQLTRIHSRMELGRDHPSLYRLRIDRDYPEESIGLRVITDLRCMTQVCLVRELEYSDETQRTIDSILGDEYARTSD